MTEPTLATVASKLDAVAAEVHEMRVWIVGNGEPGIFGKIRRLRDDLAAHLRAPAHLHVGRAEQRNGNAWNWRRLAYDVSRNVMTVLVLGVGAWAFGAFVLQLRVSLGGGP